MGKPAAPASPNYAQAATAQGAANVEAAQASAQLSNPNIISPYGNQTVTYNGNIPTVTQTLTPTAQQTLTQQQLAQLGLSQVANQQVSQIGNLLNTPFSLNGYSSTQTGATGTTGTGGTQQQAGYQQNSDGTYTYQITGPGGTFSTTVSQNPDDYAQILASGGSGYSIVPPTGGTGGGTTSTGGGSGTPGSIQVRMPDGTTQTFSSIDESLNQAFINGGAIVRPDGSTVLPQQAGAPGQQGWIADNQPLNVWMGMGWQPGQRESLGLPADGNAELGIQRQIGPAGAIQSAPSAQQQVYGAHYGQIQGAPNLGIFGQAQGLYGTPQAQTSLNTGNVAALPVNAGMTAQQAILSRLQPTLQQQRASTENQLIQQGLRPGDEAYDNAIRLLGQQENDQLTQAALQGLNLDFSANQQGFGQALASGQFTNQGIGQGFQQGLSNQQLWNQSTGQNQQAALAQQQAANMAQEQGFGQAQTMQGAQNQALQQNFQNQTTQQQLQNQAQQQYFNQMLQQAQFGNTAAQQALSQILTARELPINEIAALMSGSQVQTPQFQGYTGATTQPAPLFQATQAQGQWDQNAYAQQVAQRNALMSGLFSLGRAATGGLFSLFGK